MSFSPTALFTRYLFGPAAILLATGTLACGPEQEDPEEGGGPHEECLASQGCDPNTKKKVQEKQKTPPKGQSSFYSADGQNGQRSQENVDQDANMAAPEAGADRGESAAPNRTVEEGDIYKVVQDSQNLILNLNRYRGFQVVDFSDVTNPKIIGRVQLSGTPVEMYQVGDRVYVLLNEWYNYWRSSKFAPKAQSHYGGGVVVINIKDRTKPVIESQANVKGWIRTSRLTRGGGKEALYVVSNEWKNSGVTHVHSYSVGEMGKLAVKTQLSLGGSVQDIQATPSHLIVSRFAQEGNRRSNGQSKVTLVDISSADGAMKSGATVTVKGRVAKQFNMSLHKGILRVVSGNSWSSNANTNHIETFDATDIQNLKPIDHKTFGDNEDLYATLFLGNKAFFVTYRRVDPFHAFEITDQGMITEKSEFIVSGWNDFFRPVASQTRMIGIGKNDEDGKNTLAVSLYDITDLKNKTPLIARAEVGLDHSWSEANWDHRAYSVLEKATDVLAKDGVTRETGVVLLPFSGWNDKEERYISAVQIYTFSSSTLTLRGTMEHGTQVRRSFMADRASDTTANLSEAELSLYNTSSPDQPVEKGRVALAPNYTSFTPLSKGWAVRRANRQDYYGWWGRSAQNVQRSDSLEIISTEGDVDRNEPVAVIDVPTGAQVYKTGNHLVSVSTEWDYNQPAKERKASTTVEVWDVTIPGQPTLRGDLSTDKALGQSRYYGGCYGCDWSGYYYPYYGGNSSTISTQKAVVFTSYKQHSKPEGIVKTKSYYPGDEYRYWSQGCYSSTPEEGYKRLACTYYTGSVRCSTRTRADGSQEAEVCGGLIRKCTIDAQGEGSCEGVSLDKVPNLQTRERTNDVTRRWQSVSLDVLDISNPTKPQIHSGIETSGKEEFAGIVQDGEKIYISHKNQFEVSKDSRPYVKYFVRPVDLSNPATAKLGKAINVPGKLLQARGPSLLTQDFLWGERIIEASINKLTLDGGTAYLDQVPHRFIDQVVQNVLLDGKDNALVSHQKSYVANEIDANGDWKAYDHVDYLSVLDLSGKTMKLASETEVDNWATLKEVHAGRALYRVAGGMVVMNLDDPKKPYAQGFFPMRGWYNSLSLLNTKLYLSAGRYGIYTFDINESNLPVVNQ